MNETIVINSKRISTAQFNFQTIAISIVILASLALFFGAETFILLLAVTVYISLPILILLISLLGYAIWVSFTNTSSDRYLKLISFISIPYSILALDNILYFYWPLVLQTTTIVSISFAYAIVVFLLIFKSKKYQESLEN